MRQAVSGQSRSVTVNDVFYIKVVVEAWLVKQALR
jgi:hypothetical protein